ncbi:unnamed protein product, partial [Mesorhabditis belari]|uniref:Enoyl-[acyl-carrier-protein] reductase, mitochondrial n=1 Tax=Mesorhabditis belari TaxID=2138241 RepID=A0AAF3EPE7_9BILA
MLTCLRRSAQKVNSFGRRTISSRRLVYENFGDPAKAILLQQYDLPKKLENKSVHVKWLGTPINPADINQIQGVYPIKPPMPAVGGSEGYGQIEAIGTEVRSLKVGDHVIPAKSGLGTWCSDAYLSELDVFKIDASLPSTSKATLQVNPPTAYRMLTDFVVLKEGDTIIQNGANSAVGQAVVQICRARGIKSVNIVRKRETPDAQKKLEEHMKSLGADLVITEEQLIKEYRGKFNPSLALNCVGGRSALLLAMALDHNGVMVTYGGMSKQPLSIPTGPLIFKDIKLCGFWMSRWYENKDNVKERVMMYEQLGEWIKTGKFHPPQLVARKLEEHQLALEKAQTDHSCKQFFVPND